MSLDPVAKALIALGLFFIFIGIAWQFGWIQALRLGRLPGDIAIERENMRFYFPLATSILVSVILTLALWLIRR